MYLRYVSPTRRPTFPIKGKDESSRDTYPRYMSLMRRQT